MGKDWFIVCKKPQLAIKVSSFPLLVGRGDDRRQLGFLQIDDLTVSERQFSLIEKSEFTKKTVFFVNQSTDNPASIDGTFATEPVRLDPAMPHIVRAGNVVIGIGTDYAPLCAAVDFETAMTSGNSVASHHNEVTSDKNLSPTIQKNSYSGEDLYARRWREEKRFFIRAAVVCSALLIVSSAAFLFVMMARFSAKAGNDAAELEAVRIQAVQEEKRRVQDELARREHELEEKEAAIAAKAERLLAEQNAIDKAKITEGDSLQEPEEEATTNAIDVMLPSKISLDEVSDKLVFVSVPGSTGSGFFVQLNGKVFLMTNEHVIYSDGPVTAKTIDGEAVELGEFFVADDRDLAIFKVDDEFPAFSISEEDPQEDEEVTVFGDSGGAGVISVSRGKILGYGPQQIETDADIISGNSGGPILNARRELVAVSTLMVRETIGEDKDPLYWTVKGTRFENTRRFGTRPMGTKWHKHDRKSYEAKVRKRMIEEALDFIYGRNGKGKDPARGLRFIYEAGKDSPDAQHLFCKAFCEHVANFTDFGNIDWTFVIPWFKDAYNHGLHACGLIIGIEAFYKKDYSAAIKYLTVAGDEWMGFPWYLLGSLFSEKLGSNTFHGPKHLHDDKKAKAAFENAVKAGFDNALFDLGFICLFSDDESCHDHSKAFWIFTKLLNDNPNDSIVLYCYGMAGIQTQNTSELKELDKINQKLRKGFLSSVAKRELEAKRDALRSKIRDTIKEYMKYIKRSADMGFERAQRQYMFLQKTYDVSEPRSRKHFAP